MINLKDSPYWEIYSQCWQMFKECLPARSDQAYWNDAIKRGESITAPYTGSRYYDFAVAQTTAVIDELNRLARAGKLESFKPEEKPLQIKKTRCTPTCPTQKGKM